MLEVEIQFDGALDICEDHRADQLRSVVMHTDAADYLLLRVDDWLGEEQDVFRRLSEWVLEIATEATVPPCNHLSDVEIWKVLWLLQGRVGEQKSVILV